MDNYNTTNMDFEAELFTSDDQEVLSDRDLANISTSTSVSQLTSGSTE